MNTEHKMHITSFVGYRGLVQMQKVMATHAKFSTTGVGFAKWPFALIFSVGFFLLALSFVWATVRLFVKKPEEEEKKEAEV